jgi:hypothetical protein
MTETEEPGETFLLGPLCSRAGVALVGSLWRVRGSHGRERFCSRCEAGSSHTFASGILLDVNPDTRGPSVPARHARSADRLQRRRRFDPKVAFVIDRREFL